VDSDRGRQQEEGDTENGSEESVFEYRRRWFERDTGALRGLPGKPVGVVYRAMEPVVVSLVRNGVSPIRHGGGDGSGVDRDNRDAHFAGERVQLLTSVGLVLDFVPERHGDGADFPLDQR